MNPLLEVSDKPFEAIDFDRLKAQDFLPALEFAIAEAKERLEALKKQQNDDLDFDKVILKQESATDKLDQVVEVFYALYSAHCTEEISSIAEEFNQKLTQFSSDVSLDAELFEKIKYLYENQSKFQLDQEQKTVLEKSYKDFVRNGALLNEKDQDTLREIDQNLSQLNLKFSENVRKATNSYVMFVENEQDLSGLPDGVKQAAKEKAKEKDEPNKWAFTLDFPSYYPFLQYADNRELRKKIWMAASTRATSGEFDNRDVILQTLKLRQKRAELLGYKDHPSFILENRMAKSPDKVLSFIDNIVEKALPKAKADMASLKEFKKELSGDDDLRKYDQAYYTEKLKKKVLDFDDEELRPYFKLENVLDGIFKVANKLYGLNFKERKDIPKYHQDVVTYEVTEADGNYLGLFYGDYFPRAEKRPGAWMTTLRVGGFQFGEIKRPFVCNVCNFTKPSGEKPSLLSLNEVLTLFHEFGHGLHGLMTKAKYRSVAGANVFWDFVELPSQIMENWVLEKECLDLFAKHYETKEKMPQELIQKVKKAQQFMQGVATIRQMSFAKLDMDWHLAQAEDIADVMSFEEKSMQKFELLPREDGQNMSCSFGHIFAGGYSSGYYSYKWAEVLDADAFAFFKEKGIFDSDIAASFKENILEKGGSEDPMELYKRFRGQGPDEEALLRRGGLL